MTMTPQETHARAKRLLDECFDTAFGVTLLTTQALSFGKTESLLVSIETPGGFGAVLESMWKSRPKEAAHISQADFETMLITRLVVLGTFKIVDTIEKSVKEVSVEELDRLMQEVVAKQDLARRMLESSKEQHP